MSVPVSESNEAALTNVFVSELSEMVTVTVDASFRVKVKTLVPESNEAAFTNVSSVEYRPSRSTVTVPVSVLVNVKTPSPVLNDAELT